MKAFGFAIFYLNIENVILQIFGSCVLPLVPENGRIVPNNQSRYFSPKEKIYYSCLNQTDFLLIGDERRECLRNKWTGEAPKCLRALKRDSTLIKVIIKGLNESFERSVDFDYAYDAAFYARSQKCIQSFAGPQLWKLILSTPANFSYFEISAPKKSISNTRIVATLDENNGCN
ncbi:hypothetical protein B4U79_19006, partial [Dinothrombium tinctorium]